MGDRFFVLAYTLLAGQGDFRILDNFVDTCRSLADGIMLEIKNTGNLDIDEKTHFDIITRKTAVFFQNVSVLGGYLSGVDGEMEDYLAGLGLNFGLAFQHSDDLLDLFADPDATGKPRGSDLSAGLYTTPVIYALRNNTDFSSRFLSILKDGEPGEKEIEEIADVLRTNGAFDYVKGLVNKYGLKALGYLDKLPDGRANQALRSLVTRIVDRNY
jgi:heptaprenyl diphosphate synthase